MGMKKILMITEALGGGIYRYMLDISKGLSGKYEIYLLCRKRKELEPGFEKEIGENVKLICIDENKYGLVHMANKIRETVKSINPDVIHLHSSIAGALGRLCINTRKYKVFYTPHGFAYLNGSPWIKMQIYKTIEYIMSLFRCRIIACGRYEYEIARKMRKDSVCICNGVDVAKIQMIAGNAPVNDKFTVVTIGRTCMQKNPQLFNAVASAMPDVCFKWIGGESKDILTSPNIITMPFVDHNTAIREIAAANVYMNTSVFEGLSIALLEAMALDKPCVVSGAEGNLEVIEDGICGCICHEYKDYVAAIRSIMNDSVLAVTLGKAAQKKVTEQYNIDRVINDLEDIYWRQAE